MFLGAVALRREAATARKAGALALSIAGTGLVLAGGASGALNAPGLLLGLGAALTYTTYTSRSPTGWWPTPTRSPSPR